MLLVGERPGLATAESLSLILPTVRIGAHRREPQSRFQYSFKGRVPRAGRRAYPQLRPRHVEGAHEWRASERAPGNVHLTIK